MVAAGSRVIAVVSVVNNVALVLGEGTYVGDEVPNAELYPISACSRITGSPTPRSTWMVAALSGVASAGGGNPDQMNKRLASCEVRKITLEELRTVKSVPNAQVKSSMHQPPDNYVSDDVQSL